MSSCGGGSPASALARPTKVNKAIDARMGQTRRKLVMEHSFVCRLVESRLTSSKVVYKRRGVNKRLDDMERRPHGCRIAGEINKSLSQPSRLVHFLHRALRLDASLPRPFTQDLLHQGRVGGELFAFVAEGGEVRIDFALEQFLGVAKADLAAAI